MRLTPNHGLKRCRCLCCGESSCRPTAWDEVHEWLQGIRPNVRIRLSNVWIARPTVVDLRIATVRVADRVAMRPHRHSVERRSLDAVIKPNVQMTATISIDAFIICQDWMMRIATIVTRLTGWFQWVFLVWHGQGSASWSPSYSSVWCRLSRSGIFTATECRF